jgi:predicted metal-dependent hydrolase
MCQRLESAKMHAAMKLFSKPSWPATVRLALGARTTDVAVRISARARSYRLTVPHGGGPVLTVPRAGRWSEAEAFLRRHSGWLEKRLGAAQPAVSFAEGTMVPLRGVPHRIVATGKARGAVRVAEADGEPVLLVPGLAGHEARRLTDWLKSEAGRDLTERSAVHARTLGVTVTGVTIRSPRSRWGSCSARGRLNFNWRLVMAPPHVLDYVAAHEVAHLVEMNHSPAFWRAVTRALPEMAEGRAWLKRHGAELMAYGAGQNPPR